MVVMLILPRDGGVEELHRDPTVGHALRSGPEIKNGRSSDQHIINNCRSCFLIIVQCDVNIIIVVQISETTNKL